MAQKALGRVTAVLVKASSETKGEMVIIHISINDIAATTWEDKVYAATAAAPLGNQPRLREAPPTSTPPIAPAPSAGHSTGLRANGAKERPKK